jgi:hypothetical protein
LKQRVENRSEEIRKVIEWYPKEFVFKGSVRSYIQMLSKIRLNCLCAVIVW